jgi:dihydroorotate dehydrogenase electron transfer subunit
MSNYTVVKIKDVIKENDVTKTFVFDTPFTSLPGQFVMLWLPRVDEKPFALSTRGKNPTITIEKKGNFTKKLFTLKKGTKVGLRGPYGHGFKLKNKACIIAGGLGTVPTVLLSDELKNKGFKVTTIVGARTENRLLFLHRFRKNSDNLYITTDDGSAGEKGYATDTLEKLLEKKKFDVVYTCGPEKMMKKVFEICEKKNIECQASLERYMKCGFGICGQCVIDGMRVCVEGPVFTSAKLRKLSEFGKTARLKSGRKVNLDDYVAWRSKK